MNACQLSQMQEFVITITVGYTMAGLPLFCCYLLRKWLYRD